MGVRNKGWANILHFYSISNNNIHCRSPPVSVSPIPETQPESLASAPNEEVADESEVPIMSSSSCEQEVGLPPLQIEQLLTTIPPVENHNLEQVQPPTPPPTPHEQEAPQVNDAFAALICSDNLPSTTSEQHVDTMTNIGTFNPNEFSSA